MVDEVVIPSGLDLTETTGADGKASFDLAYGDYSVTIEADGYVTKTETMAFRSNHKNFTVTLESEPTPTFEGYIATMYDEESSADPFTNTLLKTTGLEENNRKQYSFFMGMVWISTDAVVDGITKNVMYESSDSDSPYGYVVLENVANVSDVTVTLLDSDGEPYPQGLVAIINSTQGEAIVWAYKTTDENGEAILNAPYGNWQLCYGVDQQSLLQNYEDVTIDSATETFTVQFPRVITLTIKQDNDYPLSYTTVQLGNEEFGVTDDDGIVRGAIENGTYNITLADGEYTPTPSTITIDDEHTSFNITATYNS